MVNSSPETGVGRRKFSKVGGSNVKLVKNKTKKAIMAFKWEARLKLEYGIKILSFFPKCRQSFRFSSSEISMLYTWP
jgi:hypothetical protein